MGTIEQVAAKAAKRLWFQCSRPMNAEAQKRVKSQKGVKEETLPKKEYRNVPADIRNGIEGQQKLSRSVQAKEVQYGE
jgi:hypothetical protein